MTPKLSIAATQPRVHWALNSRKKSTPYDAGTSSGILAHRLQNIIATTGTIDNLGADPGGTPLENVRCVGQVTAKALSTSLLVWQAEVMKQANRYHGHRFPREVISTAVWLYHRFSLSFRDVEDQLAQRGVTVSYETVRRWCLKFGPMYQRTLKRREAKVANRWFTDKVFITINGEHLYLWRAEDQDGDVLDILVQRRRNQVAAECFFRKVVKRQGRASRVVVSDRLRSCPAAITNVLYCTEHDTRCYANNRAENSYRATRRRERQMQRFKSAEQAQRFLSLHPRVNSLFRYGRHSLTAQNHRLLRDLVESAKQVLSIMLSDQGEQVGGLQEIPPQGSKGGHCPACGRALNARDWARGTSRGGATSGAADEATR